MNRVDGKGFQDMECPVSRLSKCRKPTLNRMLSGHTIYGCRETECLVDIVSGLVDTHSHMQVHARTHTHAH